MPFQPPINNLLIKVATKYIGNYTNIMKAANLNPANKLNPLDLVNIVGEVVALPKAIDNKRKGMDGYSLKDIEVGDTVCFRYDIVGDFFINTETDNIEYKNMVWYKGKEYWLCDITRAFFVIKKESKSIKMINGYVMLEDIQEENQIYLPASMKRISRAKEATLAQIGNPLSTQKGIAAFPGDKVLVHPLKLQHYQIGGKKFAICRQENVFGRMVD